MSVRQVAFGMLGLALLLAADAATAAPLTPASGAQATPAGSTAQAVDYRPYYHCHGPKRCHGKGNYYKYDPRLTPEDFSIADRCRYGRGCGYNNGWNSPSARYQYTGRRWHRHRRHRH